MNLRLVQRAHEPPAELDDVTLARARRQDAAACRALLERYQRPVFALLSRMLRPTGLGEHVEDLAQETFLRVFRALAGFKPHGTAGGGAKLSTWILTIATRLAIDELRRLRPAHGDDAGVPELVARERSDRGAHVNELGRALEGALGELPEHMRAAFVLRAWHELSHEEIARVLDVDVGTVKSRIARARARLRESLPLQLRAGDAPPSEVSP